MSAVYRFCSRVLRSKCSEGRLLIVTKVPNLPTICHVDSSIVDAQISNSLSYGEVIETVFDERHALVYKNVPLSKLSRVLRLLRLCDSKSVTAAA